MHHICLTKSNSFCHRHPIVPHIHCKFTNRHFHLHQLFLKLSFSFSFSILKMLAFHFPCPLITNHQLPLVFVAQFAFLFFKTSFLCNGKIPVARKPDKRFSCFRKWNTLYKIDGNMVFGRLPAHWDSFLQVFKMSRHSIFVGRNTATSKGWHKCVELGGNHENRMSFSSQYWRTFFETCDHKLLPIKTIGPTKSLVYGTNYLKNHISNCSISNHPLFAQEYTVSMGPPRHHSLYTFFALYTTIGGK